MSAEVAQHAAGLASRIAELDDVQTSAQQIAAAARAKVGFAKLARETAQARAAAAQERVKWLENGGLGQLPQPSSVTIQAAAVNTIVANGLVAYSPPLAHVVQVRQAEALEAAVARAETVEARLAIQVKRHDVVEREMELELARQHEDTGLLSTRLQAQTQAQEELMVRLQEQATTMAAALSVEQAGRLVAEQRAETAEQLVEAAAAAAEAAGAGAVMAVAQAKAAGARGATAAAEAAAAAAVADAAAAKAAAHDQLEREHQRVTELDEMLSEATGRAEHFKEQKLRYQVKAAAASASRCSVYRALFVASGCDLGGHVLRLSDTFARGQALVAEKLQVVSQSLLSRLAVPVVPAVPLSFQLCVLMRWSLVFENGHRTIAFDARPTNADYPLTKWPESPRIVGGGARIRRRLCRRRARPVALLIHHAPGHGPVLPPRGHRRATVEQPGGGGGAGGAGGGRGGGWGGGCGGRANLEQAAGVRCEL